MQLFEKARPDNTLKTVELKENHKTHMESAEPLGFICQLECDIIQNGINFLYLVPLHRILKRSTLNTNY